jgi:hypothetical protein
MAMSAGREFGFPTGLVWFAYQFLSGDPEQVPKQINTVATSGTNTKTTPGASNPTGYGVDGDDDDGPNVGAIVGGKPWSPDIKSQLDLTVNKQQASSVRLFRSQFSRSWPSFSCETIAQSRLDKLNNHTCQNRKKTHTNTVRSRMGLLPLFLSPHT